MPMPNKTCHVLLGWVCWAPKHGSCQPPGTGTPWFVALSMESMGDPVQACSLALVGLDWPATGPPTLEVSGSGVDALENLGSPGL